MKLIRYILLTILFLYFTAHIINAATRNIVEIVTYIAYDGKVFNNKLECDIYEKVIKLADTLKLNKDRPTQCTSPFSNGRINNSNYENFVNDMISIIGVVNDKNYELNLSLIKKNVTIVSSDNYLECLGTSTEAIKTRLQEYDINCINPIFNKIKEILKN